MTRGSFGMVAAQLAGIAARGLGWRPAEFWNATPADLALSISEPDSATAAMSRSELNQLIESEHNG